MMKLKVNLNPNLRNIKFVLQQVLMRMKNFCSQDPYFVEKKINKLITVIIPRHINRVNKINNQLKNLNLKTVYHSSKINNLDNIDIYIVDTFGDSKKFW